MRRWEPVPGKQGVWTNGEEVAAFPEIAELRARWPEVMDGLGRHFLDAVPHLNFLPWDEFDEGFDERWKRFPAPQATTRGVFEKELGWSPSHLAGKLVLDAGCGCGRFAALVGAAGGRVVGVDMSPHALRACMDNAPDMLRVRADLLDLPFEDGLFDAAYSIGVLHHTEDTRRAFVEVARTVKPGGEFAIWVYEKPVTDDRLLPALEMLHDMTRAIPRGVLFDIFERHAARVAASYNKAWGPLEQILRVSNSEDDDERISDTLDWHAAGYRWWHTQRQVDAWFAEAGFDVTWRGDFPVSAHGRKREG